MKWPCENTLTAAIAKIGQKEWRKETQGNHERWDEIAENMG
jgi:hypothetical protein